MGLSIVREHIGAQMTEPFYKKEMGLAWLKGIGIAVLLDTNVDERGRFVTVGGLT